MQTVITYNDVIIKDVHTDSIEHSVEKDSTGVDQIGVRVTATFTGTVHTGAQDTIGVKIGSKDANSAATTFGKDLSSLLASLTKDRRRFTMQIGQSRLYDIRPGAIEPGVVPNVFPTFTLPDIANGPIPSVSVIKITSGNSASVRFSITFTIPNCDGRGSLAPSGLINFRFWIFEDVDCTTWLTSRTYQGRIRVAHKNVSPHAMARVVTIPSLERGFQRRVINWHESSDGLHLDFTFQDQEKIASAPWNRFSGVGASDWSGNLKMSSNTFGITGTVELDFRLTGPKGTSKLDLLDIAFRICQAKAKLFDFTPGGVNARQGYMEYFGLGESLHANEVTAQCRIMHTGGAEPNKGVGLLSLGEDRVLGQSLADDPAMKQIGYDPDRHILPALTAATSTMFTSLLQLVCAPNKMPNALTAPVPKPRQGRQQDQQISESSDDLSYEQSSASPSQLKNMYLEYGLTSEIFANSGRIALATGASADSELPTLAVVTLHQPTALREIRIDASRINDNPELPTPNIAFADANGIVHTMIGEAEIVGVAPQVSADNRKLLYRSKMKMRYALSRVPSTNESLPVGCVPYRVVSLGDPSRVIVPAAFVQPGSILR